MFTQQCNWRKTGYGKKTGITQRNNLDTFNCLYDVLNNQHAWYRRSHIAYKLYASALCISPSVWASYYEEYLEKVNFFLARRGILMSIPLQCCSLAIS